jgi:hypothetical protein
MMFLEYPRLIGIRFSFTEVDVSTVNDDPPLNRGCIFELFQATNNQIIHDQLSLVDRPKPYIFLSQTVKFCKKIRIGFGHPGIEMIKIVNAKVSATEIRDTRELKKYGSSSSGRDFNNDFENNGYFEITKSMKGGTRRAA